MNEEIKKQILDKIKTYNRIIISRHIRPDGDAVGSTKGLCEILRLSFPEKEIYLQSEDYCDYVSFLGGEDEKLSEEMYKDALLIVLDTATEERISNTQYKLAKEIIKIDHHVDVAPYGDIFWVEDWRSSACEMVVDFYMTFKDELKLNKDAATYLYTGMVTDSGRFRFSSTNGDTLRCAAVLLDQDIDIETIYAHLNLQEFDYLKYSAYVYKKMRITENGVAYIYVDRKMQKKFRLTSEEASNTISLLANIKGCIVWLAFIDYEGDPLIRVRLRSRFVTINKLAEQYSGGGHECAAGAAVKNKKEMKELIDKADIISRDYKANNTRWL